MSGGAMSGSTIDADKPRGPVADCEDMRDNFFAAKQEIEALQAIVAALELQMVSAHTEITALWAAINALPPPPLAAEMLTPGQADQRYAPAQLAADLGALRAVVERIAATPVADPPQPGARGMPVEVRA